MRLRQIEIFRAVMMSGSVSEAARRLHISQPVVSRVLGHTELGLGFALFERRRGRLVPTPEAHALFAQIQRTWGEIERIDALSANLRRGSSGLLRIAATPSLATSLLPAALSHLRADHPGVECDLWASHTHEIESHLVAFEIDAGLAIEPPEHAAIVIETLAEGEMILCAPRNWVVDPAGREAPGWLRDRPYIGLAAATPLGERLAELLQQGGHWPRRFAGVQTYALAGALVEQGLGYAFVDAFTAANLDPARVRAMRLAPRMGFRLSLMRNAGAAASLLLGRLQACLQQSACDQAKALEPRLEGCLRIVADSRAER